MCVHACKSEVTNERYCTSVDHQILKMDVLGNWILETKIGIDKLYTRSFFGLLMARAWISDEVSGFWLNSYNMVKHDFVL